MDRYIGALKKCATLLLCAAALAGCAHSPDQITAPPVTTEVPMGRLLYVSRDAGGSFRIERLDIGSAEPRMLTQSPEPLRSPRWSPDGRQFAYVGLDHGRATLFVQPLAGGAARQVLAGIDGIGAPAWSPDGRQLAFSMTRDGNTDIYLLDLASSVASRLTQEASAETEPAFSPDGTRLLLTSDREGAPQIYEFTLRRARLRLLVPEAPGASHASYAPDGGSVLFVMQGESGTSIELLNLASGERIALSQGPGDEGPVFSPDGRFVAYTAREDGGHAIELVSSDGRVRQSFKTADEVLEPSWTRPAQNQP